MDPPTDHSARKVCWLLGPDGQKYESPTPGTSGGNAKDNIYGRLDCGSALASIRKYDGAYTKHRVFFADEQAAVAAGYRPCGNCMRDRFVAWKKTQEGTWPAVNDLGGSHPCDDLGFLPPSSDEAVAENSGDGRFDVYRADRGGRRGRRRAGGQRRRRLRLPPAGRRRWPARRRRGGRARARGAARLPAPSSL